MQDRRWQMRGPKAMRQRGRDALAWAGALVVAAQVSLATAANTALPSLRDPMFFDKLHRYEGRLAEANPSPVTAVMLGSSRTAYAFCGIDLESQVAERTGKRAVAFNFGIPAAGPVTNLLGLRRLVEAGHRPDVVLVEVLPAALSDNGPAPLEHQFLHYERLSSAEVEWAVGYGFPEEATRTAWREKHLVPWHGLRFPVRGRYLAMWSPFNLRFDFGRGGDASGWSWQVVDDPTPEQRRAGIARSRGEYFEVLQRLDPTGPAGRALRDSVCLCRDRGLKLALVLMPEDAEFRGWYPAAGRIAVEAFLQRLALEFDVEVIDARTWVPDCGFSDGHHLLTAGARQFTERIAREVVVPAAAARLEARRHGR